VGVAMQEGSKGGKKAVDAELNLVPFIDLLVCCICFLLITAVWTQMARVDVSQNTLGQGKRVSALDANRPVKLLIGDDGYVLALGAQRRAIPKRGQHYDKAALASSLRDLRAELTGARPMNVVVEDGVNYRQIIEVIDIAKRERYGTVSVTSSGGMG
jgi:biopolymer transport protein ExbD